MNCRPPSEIERSELRATLLEMLKTDSVLAPNNRATVGMLIILVLLGCGQAWLMFFKATLYADHGVGPHIPTISALIIARKLVTGDIAQRGAVPCLGLFCLKDFKTYADALGLRYRETHGIAKINPIKVVTNARLIFPAKAS